MNNVICYEYGEKANKALDDYYSARDKFNKYIISCCKMLGDLDRDERENTYFRLKSKMNHLYIQCLSMGVFDREKKEHELFYYFSGKSNKTVRESNIYNYVKLYGFVP